MNPTWLAALFALSAATAWGSGDFTGGLVSRRIGSFSTVLISYTVGLLVLVMVALARFEMLPSLADLLWGTLAGLFGLAGLGCLLRGFATGRMGLVAPVSAVLATAIPVLVAAFTEGLPSALQILGFGLALAGIWLLSRPEPLGGRPAGLGLTLLDVLDRPGLLRLHTRLQEVASLSARIHLLEEWLLGRLALGKARNGIIPASLAMLRQREGHWPIPELARELALSQRQLERLYQSQVGVSPKQYAQLLARIKTSGCSQLTLTQVPQARVFPLLLMSDRN